MEGSSKKLKILLFYQSGFVAYSHNLAKYKSIDIIGNLIILEPNMKMKNIQFIFLLIILLAFSGCVEDKQADEESITDVNSIQQINEALQMGPVLIQMGYDDCPACKVQKPIMIDVQKDYQGNASVMYLNTREVPALARAFGVEYVPDSFVIVDIEDDEYRYMRYDGQTTSDRANARFVGVTRKGTLATTLDAAIIARNEK